MDRAVGENKAGTATRVKTAEALGELVGIVGEMIYRGTARGENVIDAIALLALDTAGPSCGLVAELLTAGDPNPGDLANRNRVRRAVFDLPETDIARCATFTGGVRAPKQSVGTADAAAGVATVTFEVGETPRGEANGEADASTNFWRASVARAAVNRDRRGSEGDDVLKQVAAADASLFVQRSLLDIWKQKRAPGPAFGVVDRVSRGCTGRELRVGLVLDAAGRKFAVGLLVVVQSNSDLAEMVLALHSPGGFASRLHCRQEQGNEHADDGDDNEQLDERKRPARTTNPSSADHGDLRTGDAKNGEVMPT